MKKFLLRGALFAGLAYGLFAMWIWIDNPIAFGNYFSIQRAKFNRLASIEGRKIILVGGSSVCYGFDSAKIERIFGLPVVNLGLHASVGLLYQLRSTLPYVKKDDIVLVCPEYEQFIKDQMYGGRELFYVLNNVLPEHWRFLTFRQILRNLGYVVLEEPKKAEYIWLYRQCPEGEYGQHNPRYNPNGFNVQGDEVWHWRDLRKYPIRNRGWTKKGYNREAADELALFCQKVRDLGAQMFVLPPGLYDSVFDGSIAYLDFLSGELSRRGVPFAVDPKKFRMDVSELNDSAYHLNLRGVEKRTDLVIAFLMGVLPARPNIPSVFSEPDRLPTIADVGYCIDCSSGFTNVVGSTKALTWALPAAVRESQYVRVRIPGLRSRRYRMVLRFRTSRPMHYVFVRGNKLEHVLEDENRNGANEIVIDELLNETETFVDANGDTVLGLSFPPWKVYPGDVIELTDLRLVPQSDG